MNQILEQHVSNFINAYWDKQRGLLLAYSGGPDSLALLQLLLPYCKRHSIPLALAHVNHGWREESNNEAFEIAEMASKAALPLHITTLNPKDMKGNLEAACREARLNFFKELCVAYHYQAVLMAHHADDLAETVLKRVLEGNYLTNLFGLCPLSPLSTELVPGLNIWRPLLEVPKQKIIQWLNEHMLRGFDDHTNRDPRFLRARFRTKIIPQLSKDFGKEVSPGLCRIGSDSIELKNYLDEKVAPYLSRLIVSKFGTLLDLSRDCPTASIELKHLIRRCCESHVLPWSRDSVEIAAQFLMDGSADKQVVMGARHMYIDRGRLFIVNEKIRVLPSEFIELKPGEWEFGQWTVKVTSTEMPSDLCSNWRSLWQEEGEAVLPAGNYHMGQPSLNALYPRNSTLSKWWTSHKVPAFFRLHVPVIYQERKLVHEFLTGKVTLKDSVKPQQYIKIIFVKSPVNC